MHFPWGNNPPKLPLPWGELGPHLTHGSLGPPESPTQNSTSTGSAVSLQYSLPILYNGTGGACPPKTASSPGGIRAPPNTWFLRPIRVHNTNSISTGSDVSLPILYNGAGGACPPKLPLSWGIGALTQFMVPHKSITQMASRSVHPFLYDSPLCPTYTHTHTDRQRQC